MKFLILGSLLIAGNLFAQDIIKNGKYELVVNGDVRQTSTCETYQDGDYEGIKNIFSDAILTVAEMNIKDAKKVSDSPLTVTKKLSMASAQGFCALQNFLSELEITYTRYEDKVEFKYTYRCNATLYTRTLACSRF